MKLSGGVGAPFGGCAPLFLSTGGGGGVVVSLEVFRWCWRAFVSARATRGGLIPCVPPRLVWAGVSVVLLCYPPTFSRVFLVCLSFLVVPCILCPPA